jgi:putative membrane protein
MALTQQPTVTNHNQPWTVPLVLLGIYGLVFTVCAIEPYSRDVWWAENIPVMIVVAALVGFARVHRFSNTSYILMSVFIILHTIGGHYTFERVPFGWVTDFFGFDRNHYDRLAHFSVGFYAYPIAETLMTRRLVRTRWIVSLFPIFAIVTVAGIYEIIEWQYAMTADPTAGIAVLGSQGDIWDAQKDILADTLGAILVMILFFVQHREELATLNYVKRNKERQ